MIQKIVSLIFFVLLAIHGRSQSEGYATSTDGTSIYYRTFGSGQPLLIINGGPGMNSEGFESIARELSNKNLTIIYDQRGTGKSKLNKVDASTLTMKLMMEDIECLRVHLKIHKWSILGHSFGGMIASYYAGIYPDKIDKLILSSSGGIDLELLDYVGDAITSKLSNEDQEGVRYWSAKVAAGDTTHYARLQRGIHLAPAYVMNKEYLPVIAERLTQGNALVNQLMWDELRRIKFDCVPALATFSKPVLVLQGDNDILKPGTAEKCRDAFRNAKLVFIPHCIHYGWLDNKEFYLNEVNSFLTSQ